MNNTNDVISKKIAFLNICITSFFVLLKKLLNNSIQKFHESITRKNPLNSLLSILVFMIDCNVVLVAVPLIILSPTIGSFLYEKYIDIIINKESMNDIIEIIPAISIDVCMY